MLIHFNCQLNNLETPGKTRVSMRNCLSHIGLWGTVLIKLFDAGELAYCGFSAIPCLGPKLCKRGEGELSSKYVGIHPLSALDRASTVSCHHLEE